MQVWPDGRVSAPSIDGEHAVVIDTEGRQSEPREIEGSVRAVDGSGRRLAVIRVTPSGGELQLVDARTLRPASRVWPVDDRVDMVAYSRDGRRLLFATGERVEIRDGRSGAPLRELVGHNGPVNSGAFAGPDGDLAWTAGLDGTAVAFDTTGRTGVLATTKTRDAPWAGEGAARADTLVWTDLNHLDFQDGYVLRPGDRRGRPLDPGLPGCRCEASESDVTADGRLVFIGYRLYTADFTERLDRGYVLAWDAATREVRAVVPTPWPVYGVDSADDGTRAVVLGGGGWGVLDLTDLTRRDSLDVTADLDPWTRSGTGTSLAEVSPDGDRAALLVTGGVILVDLNTTEVLERRTIESEPNFVTLGRLDAGRLGARRRDDGRLVPRARRRRSRAPGAAAPGDQRHADRRRGEPRRRDRRDDRPRGRRDPLGHRHLATVWAASLRRPGRGLPPLQPGQ